MPDWIHVERHAAHYKAKCDVCNKTSFVSTREEAEGFAAAHRDHSSMEKKWLGAGDVVQAAAQVLGFKTCTPCERRRKLMNDMAPKVWKR